MSTVELERVLRLPAAERLELIGKIWDSLVHEDYQPELSDELRAEMDRRIEAFEHDGSQGLPWPEVRRRIESGEGFR